MKSALPEKPAPKLFSAGADGKGVAASPAVCVAAVGLAAHGESPALHQVDVGLVSAALAGCGDVEIALTVEGKAANQEEVTIR